MQTKCNPLISATRILYVVIMNKVGAIVLLVIVKICCIQGATQARNESCKALREAAGSVLPSGIYTLADSNGFQYQTYCDMLTNGGSWSLVASVHENNAHNNGRCSPGDRWSSDQGNSGNQLRSPNWENENTFGNVISATADDYKNPGYFSINAKDVMIWQVPNETPFPNWRKSAYLRYRTDSEFLQTYQGNLYNLFKHHFPIVSGQKQSNGPSVPIIFDEGTASNYVAHFGPSTKSKMTPGYMQFRAITVEDRAYALCPGHKVANGVDNHAEFSCLGSTGYNVHANMCGDFAGWSYSGYGSHTTYSVDKYLIESTFLIFYR